MSLDDVPALWSPTRLCGAALLIGDREVTDITTGAIQIKTASGAKQSFYRRAEPDFACVYAERLKLLTSDGEGRLRALEFTIRTCSRDRNCSLDEAKHLVLAAIRRSPTKETTSA
jgi:hypothetical protein